MDQEIQTRLRGIAVGAAVGDALGMPLEFGPASPADSPVRDMRPGRQPAGAFTDDTEMALALAESLLAHRPLDPTDLADRFVAWYHAGPPDVGIHTSRVLSRIAAGASWQEAADAVQRAHPQAASNGSVMRCWPVAIAHWNDLDALLAASHLQSRVTHPHPECVAGCAFVNAAIYYLVHGAAPAEAVAAALNTANVPEELRRVIAAAASKHREELPNSGRVRHTLESVVWALVTTASFEEAVVQAVNLGNDADTSGAVVGALAGAAYGLDAIPAAWRTAVHGEWPLRSGIRRDAAWLIALADRLAGD